MHTRFLLLLKFVLANLTQQQTRGPRRRPTPRSYSINSKQLEIKKSSLFLDIIPLTEEEHRHNNFNLDTIHTIAVNPTDRFEYDFTVDPENGKYVWMSYFLKDEGAYEFLIMDTGTNRVLHSVTNQHQFMAKLFFRHKEHLRFIFRNKGSHTFIRIFIGLECHGCNASKSLASRTEVAGSVKSIKDLDSRRSTMYFMSEMYAERQRRFLSQLKKNHGRIWMFGVLELAVIALINVYQVVAIRGMIKRRHVV
jgi:hypothetical protein